MKTYQRAYEPSYPPREYNTGWEPERGWTRQGNTAYVKRIPPGYYDEPAEGYNYQGRYEEEAEPRNQMTNQSPREDFQPHRPPIRPSHIGNAPPPATPFTPVNSHRVGRPRDNEEPLDWFPERYEVGNDAEIAEEWSDLDIHVLRRSDYSQNGRSDHSSQDNFGRPIRSTVKNLNADSFEGILPDNPFSVIRGPFPAKSKNGIRAMPILQFFTWQIELLVVRRQEDEVSSPAPGDLCQYSIVDKKGDWCGSIVLPTKLKGGSDVRPSIFIALSDAKTMTEEECPVWNYYIPKAREESEWDLYYVMMLERNHERALWERIAIGKVFQAAFRDASWSEIKLD